MEERVIADPQARVRTGGQAAAPEAHGEDTDLRLQAMLQQAARTTGRAALILVKINPNYAARAPERIRNVVAHWQRRGCEGLSAMQLAQDRYVVVAAAPGGTHGAQALAERVVRSLDPRFCPVLPRALPYAHSGISLYPDDGLAPDALIARAQQALDRAANTLRGRRSTRARPRRSRLTVLRPLAVGDRGGATT